MRRVYDPEATKKATNLTVNSDLLAKAKELKINISATLETALSEAVRRMAGEQWKIDNKEAIEEYNKFVAKHGCFSDSVRKF
jgi:antitoxin CcdA